MVTRTPWLLLLGACACTRASAPEAVVTTAAVFPADLSATVNVLEYAVPTRGAAPRGVALGLDGSLWVAEEGENRLGRFEPWNGHFREVSLSTPDSRPLGLTVARDGHVWFAASGKGYLGDLDPLGGAEVDHALPDPRAKDPTSLAFAPDGRLWFTVRRANFVGVYDPRTTELELRTLPLAGSEPDAVAVGRDGTAWVAESGANRIARIDPRGLTVTDLGLAKGARPAGLVVAADGTVFFTDVSRGLIGRLDAATGAVEEWASPGGATSKPNVIAMTPDGAVWYGESGSKPGALVRFDPRTALLAAMRLPGGCVASGMAAAPDGRVYFACANVERVGIATPR